MALKKAAKGRYATVAWMGNEKPIGDGWGSAKNKISDINATLVTIPIAVASAAHLGLKRTFEFWSFGHEIFLAIATAVKIPICMVKVAARL